MFSDVWHFLGQYIKVFFPYSFRSSRRALSLTNSVALRIWHTVTNDVQLATIQFFF